MLNRRSFIKSAAILGAGLSTVPLMASADLDYYARSETEWDYSNLYGLPADVPASIDKWIKFEWDHESGQQTLYLSDSPRDTPLEDVDWRKHTGPVESDGTGGLMAQYTHRKAGDKESFSFTACTTHPGTR